MITGLRLSQEDLAKALTGDYTDGSNFQDSVRRQIENALKQARHQNTRKILRRQRHTVGTPVQVSRSFIISPVLSVVCV